MTIYDTAKAIRGIPVRGIFESLMHQNYHAQPKAEEPTILANNIRALANRQKLMAIVASYLADQSLEKIIVL